LFQFHPAISGMLGSETSCLIAVQYPAGHGLPFVRGCSYLSSSFTFSAERTRRDMQLLTLLTNGPWKWLERDTEGSPHCYMHDISICLGPRPISSWSFTGPEITGAHECFNTNTAAKIFKK